MEVQHRNDELTSLAEESRALKDELDVLRFVGQPNRKEHFDSVFALGQTNKRKRVQKKNVNTHF